MFSATVSVGASWNSWKMMAHAEVARRDRGELVVALAVDLDLARVGRVVAGDDLDERRLAGAVLAEQGEDRAAGGVEVHPVEDLDAAERLADPVRAQENCHEVRSRGYLQAFG